MEHVAADVESALEVARVDDGDLEEDHVGVHGRSLSRRTWRILSMYSPDVALSGLVGDQPDRAAGAVAEEDLAGASKSISVDPQLEDALEPRSERDGHDRGDEEAAIFTPSGRSMTLRPSCRRRPARRHRSRRPLALPGRRAERVTATAAEVIRTSTPVAYAPPWASTLASKMQRDRRRRPR